MCVTKLQIRDYADNTNTRTMKKRKMLIILMLTFLIIFMQSCSTLNNICEDPYVQDAFKKSWKNFYGTEYPY